MVRAASPCSPGVPQRAPLPFSTTLPRPSDHSNNGAEQDWDITDFSGKNGQCPLVVVPLSFFSFSRTRWLVRGKGPRGFCPGVARPYRSGVPPAKALCRPGIRSCQSLPPENCAASGLGTRGWRTSRALACDRHWFLRSGVLHLLRLEWIRENRYGLRGCTWLLGGRVSRARGRMAQGACTCEKTTASCRESTRHCVP